MKAGILTFTYGDNYGQRLQNLAMQEFLKGYFDEVYTIKQLQNKLKFKQQVKIKLKRLMRGESIALWRRKRTFITFDKENIRFYNVGISEKTMKKFPESEFDYFVAGSDQIWSPFSADVNSTYFLTFTKKEKRIALSPSIAAEYIPDDKIDKFRSYFSGFEYISTRESVGTSLIREMTGREVETLIDPTLMFEADFWVSYEEKPDVSLPDKYALCYFLGNESERTEIERIVSKYNLTVIDLMREKNICQWDQLNFCI